MYIQFVNDNPEDVLRDCINDYQTISGRVLGAADPEMLVINSFAGRLAQAYTLINVVGNQNLINNATGILLEEIAAKFGVFRLEADFATVPILFTIAGGAPSFVIPQGMRIRSNDGSVIFAVDESTPVYSGTASVVINCTATKSGIVGNGYLSGLISSIVDPQPYVQTASNTETSSGGSDVESDDALRARAKLASGSFSVAGPTDAYIYWAKTANAGIEDVNVITTNPGQVTVYPLLKGGVIPGSGVLDEVLVILSNKKVRPQNDEVLVVAPTDIHYSITGTCKIKRSVSSVPTLTAVNAALSTYCTDYSKALGRDRTLDQLTGVAMNIPGMYSIDLGSFTDIVCAENEFAVCDGVIITLDEIVDED